jgi:protein SCO1/2
LNFLWLARIALFGIIFTQLFCQTVKNSVEDLNNIDVVSHLGKSIPLETQFFDIQGNKVQLDRYFNGEKPVLLTLSYSDCPMLCSLLLDGIVDGLQKTSFKLGTDYQMLNISIDPNETPIRSAERQQRYISELGKNTSDSSWEFLVGDEDNIKRISDSVGFQFYYDEETKQYAHPAVLMILTGNGVISSYLFGVQYSPIDLKLGILDASQGNIKSTMQKLLLYCYQYDPDGNSYSLSIVRVTQIGGFLIILAILVMVLMFNRYDKNNKERTGK